MPTGPFPAEFSAVKRRDLLLPLAFEATRGARAQESLRSPSRAFASMNSGPLRRHATVQTGDIRDGCAEDVRDTFPISMEGA